MTRTSISHQFLDEVRSKNDIVDVASKYITLNRRGGNYWACCPFHNEKTPSFSIKQDGQFFKCFGCGESGNVFNLVMKMENVDFYTAVEILAKNAGLQMPSEKDNQKMLELKQKRDRIYQVLKATTEFYHNNLLNSKNSIQKQYLEKRKISDEMIEKFQIGASLNFDDLPRHLRKLGFTPDEMISAGVVGHGERDNLYDFYGERLIFPIFNGFGDVVAYSGRAIVERDDRAKYKNTPQTLVFNKSEILFGYNFLRDLKKEHLLDTIIIVEGHIDVIACHQVGITNTIGCMGTALTPQHARKIKQLADNIILCLDGDGAGNLATYKAIDTLKSLNLNVKVVRLDPTVAKDPDEFLKKRGKEEFLDLLSRAIDCVDFVLTDSAKKYNLESNSDKSKYINEVLNYISKFSSPAEREIYLSVVQKMVKIPIDALRKSLTTSEYGKSEEKEIVESKMDTESNKYIKDSKIMLLSSILYKKIKNIDDLSGLFDSDDELSSLYAFLKEKIDNNSEYNVSMLFDNFEINDKSLIDQVINYEFPPDEVYKQYLDDTIRRVKIYELTKSLDELKSKMKNSSTVDEQISYLPKIKELQDKINKEKSK